MKLLFNPPTLLVRVGFLFLVNIVNSPVKAGTCWVMLKNTKKCDELLHRDISMEDCCRDGHLQKAWSAHSKVNPERMFRWRITGGVPMCIPCQKTCANVQCEPGMKCRMRRRQPKCVCAPKCSRYRTAHKGPLCGSDDKTYRNHCNLLKQNCRHNEDVTVAYFGQCQKSCQKVHCPDHQTCLEDQNNVPHCVYCSRTCPPVTHTDQRVCGGNGVTYDSYCQLQVATCLHGKTIGLSYHGRCRGSMSCSQLYCAAGHKCLVSPTSGQPRCVNCQRPCAMLVHPKLPAVCGNDNNTYRNYCVLRKASCRRGLLLATKHTGRCEDESATNSKHK